MAYTLGFFCADGVMYISSRGKYFSVTSTDKEVIEIIKKYLKSNHKIHVYKFPDSPRKIRYLLRIGSKSIYDSLVSLGLSPSKSLNMSLPLIPSESFPHFLRGYFDGDGCVYFEYGMGVSGQKIIKRLSIIFTSGSDIFFVGII